MLISPIIAAFALAVSIISFYFSRRSWRETYRPIVVVRVATVTAGNVATCYNLEIENCGNRPARNVRLRVKETELQRALNPKSKHDSEWIRACFEERALIHVLPNGASSAAFFGTTAAKPEDADWIPDSKFEVQLSYESFDEQNFNETMPVKISIGPSFTGACWGDEKKADGK